MAEQNHWSERGRATSVANANALGRPRRSVLALGLRWRASFMDKSLLVRIIGFPITLLHGDTLVLDRWLWLTHDYPRPKTAKHF